MACGVAAPPRAQNSLLATASLPRDDKANFLVRIYLLFHLKSLDELALIVVDRSDGSVVAIQTREELG
jgi:hypothetical protein